MPQLSPPPHPPKGDDRVVPRLIHRAYFRPTTSAKPCSPPWRSRPAVSAAELIRAVSDDDPPHTPDKTRQSHVVRLRKAVGPTTTVRVGAADQLDVDPAAIDVTRLQRHLEAGDVTAALAEWVGTPLAGLESPALQPAVDGLVEGWLGAVERDLGVGTVATVHAETRLAVPLIGRLLDPLLKRVFDNDLAVGKEQFDARRSRAGAPTP